MKRLFAMLLLLSMLLCACGAEEPAPTTEATTPTTEAPATQAPTTEAPATEATTEATEPEDLVNLYHPLTGEYLGAPYTVRPVASTINNAPAALPQFGISQADWFFEIETEGDVTRCLGIFTNPAEIGIIGPVRSARSYFISLSASFDAPLAHCGGSPFAKEHQHAYNQVLEDYRDIDEMSYPAFFYRDKDRQKNGYAFEHTLFTTGEDLQAALVHKAYDEVVNENGLDFGYQFAAQATPDGDIANDITVSFRGGKKTGMTFNQETGLYEASEYGATWVDGGNNETLSFANVIVIYADQSRLSSGHSMYELYGEGTGYFASNGKIVPIKWAREDVYKPYSFTLEDGTPVTLSVGHTYSAVVSPKGSVTFG